MAVQAIVTHTISLFPASNMHIYNVRTMEQVIHAAKLLKQ